jgi:hypothetical protein
MGGCAVSETVAVPRRLLWWLTYGTLAPVLFTVVYLVEGAVRPGYDGWRQSISALSLGPGGWVQQVNFALLGVLTVWVAYVWSRILRGGIGATWYPAMRALEGVALMAIALVATDPEPGYPPGAPQVRPFSTVHGVVHFGCLFVIIFTMMAGLLIMARRFRGDPYWRGWTWGSVLAAITINVLIALFGVANAHRFGYAGVLERLDTNVEAVWGLAVLARLWSGVPFMAPTNRDVQYHPPTQPEPAA